MALSLQTTARCLQIPLENKSLKYVVETEEQNIHEAPFYELAVKKSKVHLKPTEKGAKKLKKIDFKKATEMFINEKLNTVALSASQRKNGPLCLNVKFSDSISRGEFQALAKTINSFIRISKAKLQVYSRSPTTFKSDKDSVQSGSDLSTGMYRRSNERLTSPLVPLPSRQSFSPEYQSTYSSTRSQWPPSTKSGSIFTHYYQITPLGCKSNKIEYNPHLSPRLRSNSIGKPELHLKTSCVIYGGPISSAKNVHRSRGRIKLECGISAGERNRLDDSDGDEISSMTLPTTLSGHDNKSHIKAAIYASSAPSRRSASSQFKKMPPKRSKKINSSRQLESRPQVVYYLWDSSSGDEDESGYDEGGASYTNYSNSSCNDSLENTYSVQVKKVERLL